MIDEGINTIVSEPIKDNKITPTKNILIYPHFGDFRYNDGGIVVQYYFAKILEEYGQNVRIYSFTGNLIQNVIYNNYYNNDFPIDDNTVVVYCNGVEGNPLNAKNVVRWMLSPLGTNIPDHWVHTWGKNELVYYFNSEIKFVKNPEKMGNIYKSLCTIYINPDIKQYNFGERSGICIATRKIDWHKNPIKYYRLHDTLYDIPRNFNQAQNIEYFNKCKMFICYDPCTFLTFMAALCGCISVVYPWDGLTKQEWINTTNAAEYIKSKGLDNLYGIAYGLEDVQYAIDTLHLVKDQWIDIQNFNNENTITPFINDIQNFENMQNTIQKNFFEN